MALSGHFAPQHRCPLSGVKRTLPQASINPFLSMFFGLRVGRDILPRRGKSRAQGGYFATVACTNNWNNSDLRVRIWFRSRPRLRCSSGVPGRRRRRPCVEHSSHCSRQGPDALKSLFLADRCAGPYLPRAVAEYRSCGRLETRRRRTPPISRSW